VSIAIIPARGGSKRIPRKNIRDFCGKPMIAWPIEAARASGCFDRIVVSTDDGEIADVARACGAEVPFMRPEALADDHATTAAVLSHAVEVMGVPAGEAVCCIYPTSPFLAAEDLRAGFDLLVSSGADYVVSVARFEAPVQRALRRDDQGRIGMMHPEHASTRSQDLEPAYFDAGKFYWARAGSWAAGNPILAGNSVGIELPRGRAQDIDLADDWEWSERLFRADRAGAL
jgi:pseudaminic acid cytidylyltransferase